MIALKLIVLSNTISMLLLPVSAVIYFLYIVKLPKMSSNVPFNVIWYFAVDVEKERKLAMTCGS